MQSHWFSLNVTGLINEIKTADVRVSWISNHLYLPCIDFARESTAGI